MSPIGTRFDGGLYIGQVFGYDHRALRYVGDGGPSNEDPTPRSVWEATFTDSFGGIFGYPLEPTPEFPNPPFAVETNTLPFDGGNRGVASYGRILIREPNGLHGQIIIDANNTSAQRAGTHWLGDVEIGTGESPDTGDPNIPATPEVISTDEFRATTIGAGDGEGPLYTAVPSSFGGGAVGLVPFALHDEASLPANPDPGVTPPAVVLESVINGGFPPSPTLPDRVTIEFYGPIQTTGVPVSITTWSTQSGSDTPMDRLFSVTISPTNPRALVIMKDATVTDPIPSAIYKVVPTSALLCAGLVQPVPVAPFEYRFLVGPDCNNNGQNDCDEIAAAAGYATCVGGPLDEDENGRLDECPDLSDRECDWTANCPADYDQDGGVTGGDLAAFFTDFEAGLPCADVDQDGGITGGDLAFFFTLFEAGGC